mmetsp:Transcript_2079/g.4904  ORF Transcript_2079/g.4904 Transcript_2079/m.4904 type:complete len:215 (+) Transcript_2079:3977-4621(+)
MNSMVSSLIRSLPFCPKSTTCPRKSALFIRVTPCGLKEGSMKFTSCLATTSLAYLGAFRGSLKSSRMPSKTIWMMMAGLANFFTSPMSAGLMERIAVSASSTKGCALARSAMQVDFSAPMRVASAMHLFLIVPTLSDSLLASAEDISRLASILFVSSVATSSLICSSASTFFMSSTSCAPWMSFCSPRFTRPSFWFTSSSFILYIDVKFWMKDR